MYNWQYLMPDWPRSFSEDSLDVVTVSINHRCNQGRSTSCCPCPRSTDIECAGDEYQANRVLAARRDYQHPTIPRHPFVGERALRFRAKSASTMFDLCVRSAITSRPMTYIHIDFTHTFGDVEYAVSMHLNIRATVAGPSHQSKRSLVATTCFRASTSDIQVALQDEPHWVFRMHL